MDFLPRVSHSVLSETGYWYQNPLVILHAMRRMRGGLQQEQVSLLCIYDIQRKRQK